MPFGVETSFLKEKSEARVPFCKFFFKKDWPTPGQQPALIRGIQRYSGLLGLKGG